MPAAPLPVADTFPFPTAIVSHKQGGRGLRPSSILLHVYALLSYGTIDTEKYFVVFCFSLSHFFISFFTPFARSLAHAPAAHSASR